MRLSDTINLIQGDLTEWTGEAIVNAANVRLLGGGGVDGAIHRVAGPDLSRHIQQYVPVRSDGTRCQTAEVVVTPAFGDLRCRYILHTVGPRFDGARTAYLAGERDRDPNPKDLLRLTVRNVLWTAQSLGIQSIAMPAISCGVFGGTIPDLLRALESELDSFPRVYPYLYLFGAQDMSCALRFIHDR